MDRELLLEIGVEELPASWLPGLVKQMEDRVKAELVRIGLVLKGGAEAHGSPRRLTVCVPELTDRQEDRDELVTGPPVSAAFDADGHPTPAALGFARKLGIEFESVVQTDTPKGRYLTYLKKIRGRATVDVLPDVLTVLLKSLTFPKQMHWDAQLQDGKELVFGRPIRWLLYLYGGRVVPFTIARMAGASSPRVQDVTSGAVTYGHRFLATSGRAGRAIKVRSFDEYRKKLSENFVLLSRTERRERILRDLDTQGRRLGGRAVVHHNPLAQALLEEVPDLVEFPAVVAGAFSPEFLQLPEEVLTTTLIHHQHFFPVAKPDGTLMPAFLAVTNTQSANDRGIATNAERVVAARLRDARFFWDADRKVPLEARLERLDTVLFHAKLGSYKQKAERIEALARWIASSVFEQPAQADAAARAGRLAKADLATDMVREFTELQGTMGGVYARAAGEPEAVWKAIYHHYLPIGVEETAAPSKDTLGEARVTWAAVSLADKLDTVVGLLNAGERPTGSRDPFGLRRAAHGILRILLDAESLTGIRIRTRLPDLIVKTQENYGQTSVEAEPLVHLLKFFAERLEYILEARGFDRRNVRAVIANYKAGVETTQPVANVLENLKALPEFTTSAQFRSLATAFKRVSNIARDVPPEVSGLLGAQFDSALREPAELALLAELQARVEAAGRLGHGYREAYREAAQFEPAVAKFFTDVFVMVEDNPALRNARLRLMKRLEQLILQLGDISEIVAAES